jgi:hypothetical protein
MSFLYFLFLLASDIMSFLFEEKRHVVAEIWWNFAFISSSVLLFVLLSVRFGCCSLCNLIATSHAHVLVSRVNLSATYQTKSVI